MKQRDLINRLKEIGFEFERHGTNHDVYRRKDDIEEVLRLREIDERLAKVILRKWGIQ